MKTINFLDSRTQKERKGELKPVTTFAQFSNMEITQRIIDMKTIKEIREEWLKILEKKENHYKLREKLVIEEVKKEIQSDIQSVLNQLDGDVDRKKIANFIKEYLLTPNK